MKFLCAPHRRMLQQFPDVAQARWEEWMNQGYDALERGDWHRAVMFYGCSFEISEWMLENGRIAPDQVDLKSLDQLMVSGHLLAESLGHSGDIALERHVLLAVHRWLTTVTGDSLHAAGASRLRKNLELSVIMLKRHCQRHGDFGGSRACLTYTRELLASIPAQAVVH